MYDRAVGRAARRRPPRSSGSSRGRKQPGLSRKEKVRLTQLAICLVLFLTVFLGKGIFPQKIAGLQSRLLSVLTADTDFRQAFSQLGESLSGQGPVLEEIGQFCVEVFGGGVSVELPQDPSMAEADFLNRKSDPDQLAAHYLRTADMPQSWLSDAQEDGAGEEETVSAQPQQAAQETAQEPQSVPAVGTVLLSANYTGTPLPENYTMDQLSLGALETMNPITGHLRSTYGYRDHPVDGEYKFHNGVDIGGQEGDPIHAFAAGTVDYIGENDTHGLYLQIDHGNGVKTFYAHCSNLLVSKGQTVAMGDTVALVGSTGVATGPHLHFEIKCAGIHVDPAYYVTFLTD